MKKIFNEKDVVRSKIGEFAVKHRVELGDVNFNEFMDDSRVEEIEKTFRDDPMLPEFRAGNSRETFVAASAQRLIAAEKLAAYQPKYLEVAASIRALMYRVPYGSGDARVFSDVGLDGVDVIDPRDFMLKTPQERSFAVEQFFEQCENQNRRTLSDMCVFFSLADKIRDTDPERSNLLAFIAGSLVQKSRNYKTAMETCRMLYSRDEATVAGLG